MTARQFRTLILPLLVAALPAAASAAELPTVDEISSRYIEAVGGEAAIRAHDSIHWKGTMSVPSAGIEGPINIYSAKPNRFLLETEIPEMGSVSSGFDGEVAWMDSLMTGPMLLDGVELADAKLQADFLSELHFVDAFSDLAVAGKEEFDGELCYKVTGKLGERDMTHFFAVESGLLRGTQGTFGSPMGELFITVRTSDYKQFGGRLYPTKTVQEVMGTEQVIELTEPAFDQVEGSVFDLPPAIKALVEAQGAEDEKEPAAAAAHSG